MAAPIDAPSIGDQVARVVESLTTLLWPALAFFVVWLLRVQVRAALGRVTGLEAFGIKFALSGGIALDAAIDMADKHPTWKVDVPVADRKAAIDRANAHRTCFQGAEILWVDDRPSNNRNESRMLRSFGAMITFAATTDEALGALNVGIRQGRPFHLVISDIARDLPVPAADAGLVMLDRLRAEGHLQLVIFYVGDIKKNAGTPGGAFALTNRPDRLLDFVTDALSRVRG